MAQYLDLQARNTLSAATSAVFGYDRSGISGGAFTNYDEGTAATSIAGVSADHKLTTGAIKDAALTLAGKNIPRLGETYVQFIHPKQSRDLRSNPEFIEVTKYAAPGNFMLGEIGRLYDVVFIETTQVKKIASGTAVSYASQVGAPSDYWSAPVKANTAPGSGGNPEAPAPPLLTFTSPS